MIHNTHISILFNNNYFLGPPILFNHLNNMPNSHYSLSNHRINNLSNRSNKFSNLPNNRFNKSNNPSSVSLLNNINFTNNSFNIKRANNRDSQFNNNVNKLIYKFSD